MSSSLKLSDRAQIRLKNRIARGVFYGLIKRNKEQTLLARNRASRILNVAEREIGKISRDVIKLLVCTLYWAEGYKRQKIRNGRMLTSHSIALTNADPEMIRIFVNFLISFLEVSPSKIRANLRIFKHINSDTAINYWRKITGLKPSNFERPTYVVSRASAGKRPYNRLPFGTIQIRVNDTERFYKIMGWINGLKKQLVKSI